MSNDKEASFPDFIIAGAPKCGTTALYAILNQHPLISMSKVKEPVFFSRTPGVVKSNLAEYGPNLSGRFDYGMSWYSSLFEKGPNKIYGEASTLYFINDDSPKLIFDHAPKVKFIFMVRDPVERIYSHYWQDMKLGFELPPFQEFVEMNHPKFRYYCNISHYKKNIDRFLEYFPRNQMLFLDLDSFKGDRLGTLNAVYQFLGLTPYHHHEVSKNFNKQYDIRWKGLVRAIHKLRDSDFRIYIPFALRQYVGKVFQILIKLNRKEASHGKIDQSLKELLRPIFIEDTNFVNTERQN
ncbi:MAG: sulfotransferase domain-containing protein [Imperialibacter sp.]|uniref:sulfotransferase domain-containing protein n=1 Tax=Imperialibacter sp. TaxID=2038411 RepID=UPI0032EB5348